MIDYSLILTTHYSNKQWILKGNSYNELDWFDDSVKPTQAELDGLWEATETTKNNNAYKNQREREYPPVTDYLDGVVKGDQAQIDAYIAACQAVKNKYPKPE
jgi:hypothetical protein